MKPTDDTNSVESALGPGTRSPVPAQEPESTSRDLARSTIGKVIVEKYRVVHLLGRGGYGTVFLVETIDGTGSDRLALKVLHPHLSQSEEAKALFLNEIRVAMKVIHQHMLKRTTTIAGRAKRERFAQRTSEVQAKKRFF